MNSNVLTQTIVTGSDPRGLPEMKVEVRSLTENPP